MKCPSTPDQFVRLFCYHANCHAQIQPSDKEMLRHLFHKAQVQAQVHLMTFLEKKATFVPLDPPSPSPQGTLTITGIEQRGTVCGAYVNGVVTVKDGEGKSWTFAVSAFRNQLR